MFRTLLIVVLFSFQSLAQFEIRLDGLGADLSGSIIDTTFDGNSGILEARFYLKNITGQNKEIRIRRIKTSVPSDWNDLLVWDFGINTFGQDDYTTPNFLTIVDNSDSVMNSTFKAEFKPIFMPGNQDATALYWYYLVDEQDGSHLDSIGLRMNYYVGLNEKIFQTSISPNPATDYINVKAEGVSTATVKVVDILGNIEREEKVQGQKKIDVLDLNNGVYFVILESEGLMPVSKKIIVRH